MKIFKKGEGEPKKRSWSMKKIFKRGPKVQLAPEELDNSDPTNFIGKTVLVRSRSDGIWYGELLKKDKDEIWLKNGRHLNFWNYQKRNNGLAVFICDGIDSEEGIQVAPPIPVVWLSETITIMPIEGEPAKSIREAPITRYY